MDSSARYSPGPTLPPANWGLPAPELPVNEILDGISEAISFLDHEWRYIYVNASAQLIACRKSEELLGKSLWEVFPTALGTEFEAAAKLAVSEQRQTTLEYFSASNCWYEHRFHPTAQGVLLVTTDIDARKRLEQQAGEAERALRSETRFQRIFETAGVSIWEEDFSAVTPRLAALRAQGVSDLREYLEQHPEFVEEAHGLVTIRHLNQAALRLCGAENKEQVVSSLNRIFVPETGPVFGGELLAIWNGEKRFRAETILQPLNGEQRHVALTMEIPPDDPALSSVLVTLMDITPRIDAEALMRASDERQRRAVEAGKVGLWEWDIQNNAVTWSDYIYDLHGLERGSFGGTVQEFASLVHPSDRDGVSQKLNKALGGEGTYEAEFRPLRPDGQVTWLTTTGRVTFNEKGHPVWMHGAVIDRTAQKNAEEAQLAIERQLMLLVEASGALLASPHSVEVLRTIVELAQRFVSADAHSVWRKASEDGVWRLASSAGLSAEYIRTGMTRDEGGSPLSTSPMLFEDILREPSLALRHDALIREGVRSMLVIPLHVHGQPNGTLVFYWKTPHQFTGAELRIASALGNLAASALGTAELYEREIKLRGQAEASERRAAFLAEAGAVLSSSLDYQSTLASVAKLAVPSFADWSSVDLLDANGEVRRVAVAHCDPDKIRFAYEFSKRYPPREDDRGRVALRTGKSVLVEDIPDELLVQSSRDAEQLRLMRELGLRSYIVAPMVVSGRGIGTITFVTAESGRRYATPDLQTAEELARRAAAAIENAGLYRHVRTSEERYRSLVSATTSVVWTIDPSGAFVQPQPSWEAYTGQVWEQHRGFGWADALHPEDRERVMAEWIRCRDEEKTYEVEGRVWHAPSAEYRYFIARPVPVRNEDGSVREWIGTVTDIHEQRQAEEELNALFVREQEARKTAELLNRVGPILSAELEPRKLAQRITDLATELAGAEFGALFHNVLNELGESYTLYSLSGAPPEAFSSFPLPRNTAVFGPTFRGEGIVLSSDITKDPRYGKNAPYHGMPEAHLPVRSYLAVPVVSRSGGVLGGLFFGHSAAGIFTEQASQLVAGLAAQAAIALDNARLFDESQRTQEALRHSNQELQRANEDLNQFAYSASHDLQEPLRMVSIYSQLVKSKFEARLGSQGAQYLDYAIEGSQRMERLVSDILAYAQAANTPDEHVHSIDAADVLTKALANLQGIIEESGAQITYGTLPLLPVREIHLMQLFQNLIGNAIKYRAQSTPRVSVAAVLNEDYWRFSITDNGIGIEPEYKEQIFGLFKRLHPAAKYAGTGIGLAICQRIVERYRGLIWVESELGQGATFFFTLPAGQPGKAGRER